MNRTYRDLLKHSGIYGLGHILSRLASVLLLPVYTRYLGPAEYGVLAIVDLLVALLGIVLASGTVRALNRYHFEADTERERDRLWWTGVALLLVTAAAILLPAFLLRDPLARLALGPAETRGGLFLAIALPTLGLTALEQLLQVHLRVYKRSGLLVAVSLGRLLLNIALNLLFLIRFGLGVAAILTGNLLAAGVSCLVLLTLFAGQRGRPGLERALVGRLFAYGGPLIVTALLAVAMHQADRYLLRVLLDLGEVGIYSVAYAIGQGINTLILTPFSQIWYVAVYEVRREPGARRIYVEVFRAFFSILALVMLAVSLFARPLVRLLATERFQPAAELVPLVCLAYLFFSLHAHFNVPVLLAKTTSRLLPAHVVGVVVNVAANLVLIPPLGARGAALASIVTFGAFSFTGLAVYRRIERYEYPLGRASLVLAGLVASYLVWSRAASWDSRPMAAAISAALVWSAWAAVLLAPLLVRWRRARGAAAAGGESPAS